MVGEERAGRVGDLHEPPVGHLEHADLLGRPVPVLRRPEQAQAAGAVALDREDDVHEVLERLGPGERAVLGHVPDQHHRHAVGLGELHQAQRGLADLADAPGRPVELVGRDRLDGVHDEQPRRVGAGELDDPAHVRLGDDADALGGRAGRQPEACRPQPHLRPRLLARRVQDAGPGGHAGRDLEQERGLADPGLAADQHDRPGDEPAAEHAVELADPHRAADLGVAVIGMGQGRPGRLRRRIAVGRLRGSSRTTVSTSVFHSPHGPALALPAGNGGATGLADESTLDAGHGRLPVPQGQASTGVFASTVPIDSPLASGSRSISIVSPWLYRPSSRCSASGSSIRFWIVRRSGRAPYAAS